VNQIQVPKVKRDIKEEERENNEEHSKHQQQNSKGQQMDRPLLNSKIVFIIIPVKKSDETANLTPSLDH